MTHFYDHVLLHKNAANSVSVSAVKKNIFAFFFNANSIGDRVSEREKENFLL